MTKMPKRILHLNLIKKWFDLIAIGQKTLEFRENTPYWRVRMFYKDGEPKQFDEILFRNGYGKNAPSMRVKFNSISFGSNNLIIGSNNLIKGLLLHGEELPDEFIVIELGEVIEVNRLGFLSNSNQ